MCRRRLDIAESLVSLVAVGKTADVVCVVSSLERVVVLVVAHLCLLALEHVRLCCSVNLYLHSCLLVVVAVLNANCNDVVAHALLSSQRDVECRLLGVLLDCADLHVAVLACSSTLELRVLSHLAEVVSYVDVVGLASVDSHLLRRCRNLHAVVLLAVNLKLPDAEDAVDVRNELHVASASRSDEVGLDALALTVVCVYNSCPVLVVLREQNLVRVDLVYARLRT